MLYGLLHLLFLNSCIMFILSNVFVIKFFLAYSTVLHNIIIYNSFIYDVKNINLRMVIPSYSYKDNQFNYKFSRKEKL